MTVRKRTKRKEKIEKEKKVAFIKDEIKKTNTNKRNNQIILSLGAVFAFAGLLLLVMYDPLSFFPWIILFFGLLVGAWGTYDLSTSSKKLKALMKELNTELPPKNKK
jgi:hypothetical protein